MRCLVAGGAGFIGSHLCEALIRDGHHVECLDTLSTGSMENVSRFFNTRQFSFVQIDVCSTSDISIEADWIFHLASPAAPGDIRRLKESALTSNTHGTSLLMKLAKKQGAKFMFISSMKVLGNCARVQPYIFGKRFGEEICSTNGAKVARLASVYGPRMRLDDSRVIPVFIRNALNNIPLSLWNGGRQLDSFCYITDIVDGLIRFMRSDHTGVMEMGSEEPISIIELGYKIAGLTNMQANFYTDEKVLVVEECHKVPDISRARELLGWEPKISLEEGLKRTIAYVAEKDQKNNLHPGDQQLATEHHGSHISPPEAVCGEDRG